MEIAFRSGWRRDGDGVASAAPSFEAVRGRMAASVPNFEGHASDLRRFSPRGARQNQYRSSSCVAQSTVRAVEIKRVVQAYWAARARGESDQAALAYALSQHRDLSRMQLYFLTRELMSPPETDRDDGTFPSLAAEALTRQGVCLESDWPWDEGKMFVPPSWKAMRGAAVHKVKSWARIGSRGDDRVLDVILNLAVDNPVVYGTTVGQNWLRYDGSAPLDLIEGNVVGRHATVLIGWDPARQLFIGENSWGTGWGLDGFYEITPDVIASAHDSDDFVTFFGGWEDYLEKL